MIKKYALKTICVGFLLIAIIAVLTGAVSYPAPTNDFFVNDFANVISDSDEMEMLSKGATLFKNTGAQVVVVTVDSLEGMAVNDYALQLGNKWGVGKQKEDTGIVLLLSVGDRKTTIQVGYGLEGAVNDAKAGRILDTYALPYFTVDNFSTGLMGAYSALVNEVYTEFGITGNIDEEYISHQSEEKASPIEIIGMMAVIVIIIIIFIKNPRLFLYAIAFGGRGGRGGRGSGGGFSGGGGRFGGGGASRGF